MALFINEQNTVCNNEYIGLKMGIGWTAEGICEFLGGKWLTPMSNDWIADDFIHTLDIISCGVGIQTSNTVLIIGNNIDGSKFNISKYVSKVIGIITPKLLEDIPDNVPQLIIDTNVKPWKMLAEATRMMMTGKIIGITGSVGKTSTKSMLSHVLKQFGSVRHTIGNHNNVGGCFHVFTGCSNNPDYAIVELASDILKRKDRYNARLLSPHLVIITPICLSHAELGFKDEFDVARVKARICEYIQPNGVCFIPYDMATYQLVREAVLGYGAFPVSYGFDKNADIRISNLEITDDGSIIDAEIYSEKISYKIPTFGEGMALNSLAGLGAVHHLGIDVREASKHLCSISFPSSRQEIVEVNLSDGITRIINDCFNAQPLSVFDSLKMLKNMPNPKGRKIAILGPIRTYNIEELKEEYLSFVQQILDSNIDLIFLVGDIKVIADYLPKGKLAAIFATRENAIKEIKEIVSFIKADDLVLVKVSSAGWLKDNLAVKLVDAIKKINIKKEI